jgi:hypothetical protein
MGKGSLLTAKGWLGNVSTFFLLKASVWTTIAWGVSMGFFGTFGIRQLGQTDTQGTRIHQQFEP